MYFPEVLQARKCQGCTYTFKMVRRRGVISNIVHPTTHPDNTLGCTNFITTEGMASYLIKGNIYDIKNPRSINASLSSILEAAKAFRTSLIAARPH
jgi:hypothetical protein